MADRADRFYFKMLVVRCQVGDRCAFAELVAEFQPRLGAFLGKMLGDVHQADDIQQDVWMDVFRDLRRLAEPASFIPWMYRIARNREFLALRRKSHPTIPIDIEAARVQKHG